MPKPPPGPAPQGTVLSIQILRGVAALLVVLYHYAPYLGAHTPLHGGYVGVDVFFVISGFVIVHATRSAAHADPVDFVIRRFFRVVPLAQGMTLAYFAITNVRPSLRLLGLSLVFWPRSDTIPPVFGFPVIPQAWTLTYEIVFYGVFASALALSHRHRVLGASVALAGSIVAFQWALGGPLTLHADQVRLAGTQAGAVMGVLGNPILLEFIAGMALAALYPRLAFLAGNPVRRGAAFAAGGTLVALFIWNYLSNDQSANGLLDKGWSAVCLVAGGLAIERSAVAWPDLLRRRLLPPLLFLGAISYALYLLHFAVSDRLLQRTLAYTLGLRVAGPWGFAGLLATAIALATGVHLWIERPLIALGKRLVDARRTAPLRA